MAKTELQGGKKVILGLTTISRKTDVRVTSGFYPKSRYEDGTPVAQVAYWNNFGVASKGHFIPPRPFFSDTVRNNKKRWTEILGKFLKKREYSGEQAGYLLGEQMRQDIADSILESRAGSPYKPNAPATIRMSNNPNKEPLKDTFFMANSVNFQVKKGFNK